MPMNNTLENRFTDAPEPPRTHRVEQDVWLELLSAAADAEAVDAIWVADRMLPHEKVSS